MAAQAVRRWKGQGVKPFMRPQDARTEAVRLMPGKYVAGQALGQQSNWVAANAVQTLSVTGGPTGGSFYLNFNGDIIGPVAYNSTFGALQALLDAAPQIGTGQTVVTGGALPGTPLVITFSGSRMGSLWQPLITVQQSALTGGAAPAAAVVHTTEGRATGGMFGKYDNTLTDGRDVFRGILMTDTEVNTYGEIVRGGAYGSGEWGQTNFTAPVFMGGVFRTVDITGLDAAAIADVAAHFYTGDATKLTNPGTVIVIP